MMTPQAQQRHEEKSRRFYTAVDHREPDRVPIHVNSQIYAVIQAGYTMKECIYDRTMQKALEASKKFMLTYDTDITNSMCAYAGEGELMELVSPKYMSWAGRSGYNISENSIQQFMEKPTLQDDDLDLFFEDNGTWRLKKCQPSLCDLY